MMIAKKTSALILSGSLLVVALAGCGAAPTTSGQNPKGPVTISFMEAMSSGALKTTMQSLVTKFESTHKNIKVDLVPEPSYSVLQTKIEAEVTAGQPPTIAQAYEDWAATYSKSGAIVPLTSYVHGKNGISAADEADFWPGIWKDQKLPDGKMWMWPFNKSDFVMYYNQSWLTKDQLSVPTTWSQFATVANKVTSSSANTWGVSIDPGSTSAAANGTYLYVSLIRAYGGHLMKNGKPDFDSPASRQALKYLVSLYKSGALKLGTNYPGQTALGAAHSLFDLSTIASYYYNEQSVGKKFTMNVASFPSGPSGSGNVLQGTNIVMFSKSTSAQKNAAWTFMKWLTEPAQTANWATNTGYLPVRKSAVSLMTSYYQSHPYQKIAADSLAAARPVPPVAGFSEAIGALANAIQEATVGHQSVGTALSQAEQQATSDLSNQ